MNKMRELREAKGISMREAATKLAMPYTTYVNYEKGFREPNSETLIAIAQFYDVTIDYLLGNDTHAKKEAPTSEGERNIDDDIKFALFGGDGEITDAMFEEVRQFAAFVKNRESQKKKEQQ